jgi:hypothetical protein
MTWQNEIYPTCPHFASVFLDASIASIEIGGLATRDSQNHDTYLIPSFPICIWQRNEIGHIDQMNPDQADVTTLRAIARIANYASIQNIIRYYSNYCHWDEDINEVSFRVFFMRNCTIISPDNSTTDRLPKDDPSLALHLGVIVAHRPQSGHEKLSVTKSLGTDASAHIAILNFTRQEPLVYGGIDTAGMIV